MKVLGKIMPRFLGDYDPTFVYDVIDVVSYDGLWATKVPNVTGIEPSEENSDYWTLILPKGEAGTNGTNGKTAYEYAVEEGGYLGTEDEFGVKLATDFIDWFGVGTSIPESADLDNYKTKGKYYCGSEARAQTLSNRPPGMNTNFCMWVFNRTSSSIYSQLMMTLTGKIFFRSSSSSAWRGWTAYTTSDEILELMETVKQEILAEISENTQSDWSQNDDTTVEYVKNRPCYDKDKVVISERQVIIDYESGYYYTSVTGTEDVIVEGNEYMVELDGTRYTCTAYRPVSNSTGESYEGIFLGNTYACADLKPADEYLLNDTGEPFCIVLLDTGVTLFGKDLDGIYTVAVYEKGTGEPERLPERFLPLLTDTVTGTQYRLYVKNGQLIMNDGTIDIIIGSGSSDSTSSNSDYIWLLHNAVFSWSEEEQVYYYNADVELVDGVSYTFVVNGTYYSGVACYSEDRDHIYIEDGSVVVYYLLTDASLGNFNIATGTTGSSGDTITFSIAETNSQNDWLIYNIEAPWDDMELAYAITSDVELVAGVSYTFVVNGTLCSGIAYAVDSTIYIDDDDNEYYIISNYDSADDDYYITIYCKDNENIGDTISFSIREA